ncbi:MAG: VanZ family protein [Deltaproteobacteria bacterium]|nr:VanZ family protein [Deltaproteobacteria bacterium]
MPSLPRNWDLWLTPGWLGGIVLVTFQGRALVAWLDRSGLDWVTWFLALAGAAAGAGLLWGSRRRPPAARPRLFLAALLAGLALGLLAWAQGNPVERTHVVLYGVLGLLLYHLAGRRLGGPGRAAAAALACFCLGGLDEFIQHLLPDRVGDWRDVATNGAAGLVCVAAAWAAGGGAATRGRDIALP